MDLKILTIIQDTDKTVPYNKAILETTECFLLIMIIILNVNV